MATPTVSTVPEALDLQVYAGDSLSIPIEVRDKTTKALVDLAQYEIASQVRKTRKSSTATVTATIVRVSLGRFDVRLSGAQTAAIPCGEKPTDAASQYVWDAEIKSPSGVVTTVRRGAFVVWADVSRPTV